MLGDDRLDARRVERPRLGHERAALGHDVRRADAALDGADVRRRPVVEPPERHRRDRARGGEDRAAAVLGPDAGVRRAPVELRPKPVQGGRGDDDLADRRRVVEHVAESRAQARAVEGLRAAQRVLLGDREQQLEPDRRRLRRAARRAASRITAIAALLSAPRMPSLAFSQPPSTITGSTGAAVSTVSRCAHEQHTGVVAAAAGHPGEQVARARPAVRAAPSSSTSRPSARSSAATRPRTRARARTGSRCGTAPRTSPRAARARPRPARPHADAMRAAVGDGTRRRPLGSRSRARERGADELAEQRRRALGPRLELGVELRGDEERVVAGSR